MVKKVEIDDSHPMMQDAMTVGMLKKLLVEWEVADDTVICLIDPHSDADIDDQEGRSFPVFGMVLGSADGPNSRDLLMFDARLDQEDLPEEESSNGHTLH